MLAAERLHGDDTTVPVLAKTTTGRLWAYVRDDRPFGGPEPSTAVFCYSPDRGGDHSRGHLARYAGILQANAYVGFNELCLPGRIMGAITEAACWSHGRPKFVVLADVAKAPLVIEAVRRIDLIFVVERDINGLNPSQRHAARKERVVALVADLETWMRVERTRLSRYNDISRTMDYMLNRWPRFVRFLDDGRICLTNNAAERALRGIALGRNSWLFAGSDRVGIRAADVYTLIITAKLNNADPHAWLADVLRRIADQPARNLEDLLPWNWSASITQPVAAA